MMRRLHLIVGTLALLVFIGSGVYMRTHRVAIMHDDERLLFRSRHIYILASAVANLLLGAYVRAIRTRLNLQLAGSVFLVSSATLLFIAFVVEPVWSHPPGAFSRFGLFALLAGGLLHVLATVGARENSSF